MNDTIRTGIERAKAAADAFPARIRAIHERDCATWETWTEHNVRLLEGGRADVTFDGCREHHVAVARP